MATYAGQDAVATSSRSLHHVKASGPWAGELNDLLDALVREKPRWRGGACPVVNKRQERQNRAAAHKARREATERLDGIGERIGELRIDQNEQDLDSAWSGWMPRHSTLRQPLAGRRAQLISAAGDE